jgi:hypothetical protein
MTTLHSTLNHLAADFAAAVLQALRGASIDEISGLLGAARVAKVRGAGAGSRGGRRSGGRRLGRRSKADIEAVVDRIVGLLQKHPRGLRAEQIRAQLSLQAKELPRPIAEALGRRRISKQGQKRATTYFVRRGGASAPARGRGKKKGGRGRARSAKGAKGANAVAAHA